MNHNLVVTISFWSRPNHYGQVQINSVRPKPFWIDPECFGHIEGQGIGVESLWIKLYNYNLIFASKNNTSSNIRFCFSFCPQQDFIIMTLAVCCKQQLVWYQRLHFSRDLSDARNRSQTDNVKHNFKEIKFE